MVTKHERGFTGSEKPARGTNYRSWDDYTQDSTFDRHVARTKEPPTHGWGATGTDSKATYSEKLTDKERKVWELLHEAHYWYLNNMYLPHAINSFPEILKEFLVRVEGKPIRQNEESNE